MNQSAVYIAHRDAPDTCSPGRLIKKNTRFAGERICLAGTAYISNLVKPLSIVASGKQQH